MKRISMLAIGTVIMAGTAHAGFQETVTSVITQRGGFSGGNETVVTTEQITELRDDTPVVLQGKIVKRTGGKKYLFKDSAGSIVVEIDDDEWRGINVTPDDTIKIYGEVDRGIFNTSVDADYIELIGR